MTLYTRWQDVPRDAWRWPNFKPSEMACKGSGSLLLVPSFMDRLQRLRTAYGRSMNITSGYRSPAHNAAVSGTGDDGPHTTGRAVDIGIRGGDALDLLVLARVAGFTGIGVSQKGNSRFIHIDDLDNGPGCPRPWIWSY